MVVLVFTIVIVINAVVLYVVSPLGWPPVLIGAIGATVLLYAYSATAFTDPGTVFENDYSQVGPGSIEVANLNSGDHTGDNKGGDSMTAPINASRPNPHNVRIMECGQCQFQRPLTARHCIYCRTCVDHLDHHCPWCGRCIGDKNIKYFHYFLQLICFQFYYLLGTFIYYMLYAFADVGLPAGPSFRH